MAWRFFLKGKVRNVKCTHLPKPQVFFKDMASYSVTAWGMSETSPIGLMSRIDKIAVGSCGVVVPNTECKIGKTKNLVKLN